MLFVPGACNHAEEGGESRSRHQGISLAREHALFNQLKIKKNDKSTVHKNSFLFTAFTFLNVNLAKRNML
jgi:hypothetical protein